jgi:5-formyltetrahydrofolate cyclo-ligase
MCHGVGFMAFDRRGTNIGHGVGHGVLRNHL